MANVPTVGVYIPSTFLNTCDTPYPSGAGDVYGNHYPTGLNPGKVIEVGDTLASTLDDPKGATQLFGGAYQFIKVDSGATASNVAAGRAAFFKLDIGAAAGVQPELGYTGVVVTSQDQADANTLWAGVFLNSITPGNWGFIFVGAGRVEVTYASSLTSTAAIGDQVGIKSGAGGLFDGLGATTVSPLAVGLAVTAGVVNGTSAIYIPGIRYRIPPV